MESEAKPNKDHHENGQKESLDPAKITPTSLQSRIILEVNDYRWKCAKLKRKYNWFILTG